MDMQQKWNDVINKRERRKQLEERLFEIIDNLNDKSQFEEDDMGQERRGILVKDMHAIEAELNELDNVEEEYQKILQTKAQHISNKNPEAAQFLKGIEVATEQLDNEEYQLQTLHKDIQQIQSQFEKVLKHNEQNNLSELCNEVYNKHKSNKFEIDLNFLNKDYDDSSGKPSWYLFDNIDQTLAIIEDKLQTYLAQKIELKMRKEEYVEQHI